jgi:tetratricopeptide (TPR) repeat protein
MNTRIKRRLAAIITATIVATLTIWLSLPAARQWREQRAALQALACLSARDYPGAALRARQTLQINSNNIIACRIMAEVAEQTGSSRSIHWRQRVTQLDPGSPSDQIASAGTALFFGDLCLARKALAAVPDCHRRTNPAWHALAAQLAFAQGALPRAEQHLLIAHSLDPANWAHEINLHILRLHSPDTNIVRTARSALAPSRCDPVYGTAVLRALANEALNRHDLQCAGDLSLDLQSRSDATFGDRLLHLTILHLRSCSHERSHGCEPVTVAGALDRFLAETEAEASQDSVRSSQLLNWLKEHALAEAALEWIENVPDAVRQHNQVRRAESACYIAAGKWSQLAAWLDGSHWGADDHLRHALLALAWRKQGDEPLARIERKRAIRASPLP